MSKLNEPLPGGGNALDPPGYRDSFGETVPVVQATGPTYAPGEWVVTDVAQAAFYRRQPKPSDQPIMTLPRGTDVKVVSTAGTYVKVELESGQVGYVPAIRLTQKKADNPVPLVPSGPVDCPPPSPLDVAPEPEIPPISVEEAQGVPSLIDPEAETIE